MVFCPEHPAKRDQNAKFTPISERTSIPTPFIYGVPPGRKGGEMGNRSFGFVKKAQKESNKRYFMAVKKSRKRYGFVVY